MDKKSFENLFKEARIGNVTLKNRIIMAPMVMCYAGTVGEITEQSISHFEARAKGGVGLIIVEASMIDPSGKGFESEVSIDNDFLIPRLHMLTNAVKVNGAAIAIQLYHGGIQSHVEQPVGPSAIGRKIALPVRTPRELSTNEVEEMVERYADAALRAKMAGFDMVEVHGTHGYLIAEFLSPLTNKRTDKYGADRGLFAEEIVKRTKEKCGRDFPVIFRFLADEFEEGGITLEYSKEVARRLEAAGVDAFDVTCGNYDTDYKAINPPVYFDKQGFFFEYSSAIKKVVNVPVISGGMILDPKVADDAIGNGVVDLAFLGRQLIADPEWPNKVKSGRLDEIRPCIMCEECLRSLFFNSPVLCSVNPLKGFEYRYMSEDDIPKTKRAKKIIVCGGGLAGIEAARIAKMRGHQVILFEESGSLGGILRLVLEEKYDSRIKGLVEWYRHVAKKQSIDVRMNAKVTPEVIKNEAPDVVIFATGSDPITPRLPGVKNAVLAEDVLSRKVTVGERPVIIGGGLVGCELALRLAGEGKKVTLVECLPRVAIAEPEHVIKAIRDLLAEAHVRVSTCIPAVELYEDGVDLVDSMGRRSNVKADTIILAVGRKSKIGEGLLKTAKEVAEEVYVIGDASKPRKIIDALREGFWTAMSL